jgi:two-component system sensor histidine kinase RegB
MLRKGRRSLIFVITLASRSTLHLNLQRLQVIRAIVAGLQLAALAYARFELALNLNYTLILLILMLLALLNGGLLWRLRRAVSPSQQEFLLHLLLDVLGLCVLLYFTGGATNPFISYLLVPVTIAAATLPWLQATGVAASALCSYSLLLFYYQPLPAFMPTAAGEHAEHMSGSNPVPNLHSVGMWLNFAVSAALIIYFVVKMAAELRVREAKLRQYREETLRNEQIVAVATQAAGTAHALGTPLATMAVLLKEMVVEHTDQPLLLHDLTTLQNQVNNCRVTLQSLARKADFKHREPQQLPLAAFLKSMVQQWQLLRPEVPCHFAVPAGDSPTLAVDTTLEQALINILNNSADASPTGISIMASWDAHQWQLQVRDQGAGIAREVQELLGTSIISNKADGMGVGLVLSQATLNRLGGSVSLYPQQPHGTLTVIEVPLVQNHA